MYSNNSEYREALRVYFNMDVSALEEEYAYLRDSDPESYDELIYDERAVKTKMDDILDKTKSIDLFKRLYLLAAARFFSEDIDIGLSVLLSYDYFADFCEVYDMFDSLSEQSDCYQRLVRKLS